MPEGEHTPFDARQAAVMDGRDAEILEKKGWVLLMSSSRDFDEPVVPEGYQGFLVEGIIEGRRDLIVYDPQKAEVQTVRSQDENGPSKEQMLKDGWELVDANIARMIWIRTKKEVEAQ